MRFLKIEMDRPTNYALAKSALTIVCTATVVVLFLMPLFKSGMDYALGNAPLSEIEVGDEPGEVSFIQTVNR